MISEFENKELLCSGIAVEILFAGTRDVTIGLDDYMIELILLRKEL